MLLETISCNHGCITPSPSAGQTFLRLATFRQRQLRYYSCEGLEGYAHQRGLSYWSDSVFFVFSDIIPQLFARLNHPSAAIRNVISATLCQIAESHPEMVAFPAVVGSMSAGISKRRQDAAQGTCMHCQVSD